jgi:hypothetical protein
MEVVTPSRSLFSARPLTSSFPGLIHHVDPAWGNVFPLGVDLALAVAGHSADLDELAVGYGHIRGDPGVPRSVEHMTIADHDVIGLP